jgi:hypothetical protein
MEIAKLLLIIYTTTVASIIDIGLNPCRLICQMENSIDKCKLVSVDGNICRNMYWKDSSKQNLIVDIIQDETDVTISVEEVTKILMAPPGGCEKICKNHDSCIETGSSCRENHTCQNLFWNKGNPVTGQMTTCFELDVGGCDDGTPVLCGPLQSPKPPAQHASVLDKSDGRNQTKEGVKTASDQNSDSPSKSCSNVAPYLISSLLFIMSLL